MEINELNYEIFALDYADGTLEGAELAAMEQFLAEHPLLQEEIMAISKMELPATVDAVYSNKQALLQKRKIAVLPIAFAVSTAACLILAIGFIYMLSNNNNYGTLAEQSVNISLDNNFTITIIEQNGLDDEASVRTAMEYLTNNKEKEGSENGLHEGTNEVLSNEFVAYLATKEEESKNVGNKTTNSPIIKVKTIHEGDEFEGEIVPNYQELMPIKLERDNQSIIETTIELPSLALNKSLLVDDTQQQSVVQNDEIESNGQKRKQIIKEGVKQAIQNALMPEGLGNVLSN